MGVQPRVLFIGDDWVGSNATSLRDALIDLGCPVTTINTKALSDPVRNPSRRAWKRYLRPSYDRYASRKLGLSVAAAQRGQRFDVVIGFKALHLAAQTLHDLGAVRIHYHPDDSSNPTHRSAVFHEAESVYDLHVTTKRHNVSEIMARCGKPTHFVWCAYDPRWHFPPRDINSSGATMLGFLGTRRVDREQLILRVARRFPGQMRVVGSGWASLPDLSRVATVSGGAFGLEFAASVHRAPVQLGLLNSDNRDQHTCRTFEVPASGGLLVAERTVEHEELFDDGVNALLFSSEVELMAILERLLTDEGEVLRLRRAGLQRISSSGNTYRHRAREILSLAAQS